MAASNICDKLDRLGFEKDCIVETLVATTNPDMSWNFAPMGVKRVGASRVEIRPYTSNTTFQNLASGRDSYVSITDDPELFFTCAFKSYLSNGFQKPATGGRSSLEQVDAIMCLKEFSRRSLSEDRWAFVFECDSIEILRPFPRVVSRGRAQAIEAVINATRIERHLLLGNWSEANRLIKLFNDCIEIVERISAPDSKEARVIRALEAMIAEWREKASRSL